MALKTPVVFIIFNRPKLTERVFAEIAKAKPKKLLVIADGPRFPEEKEKCAKARDIIKKVDWDCELLTNFSDKNLGCGKRISSGLDWAFEKVNEAIILEDDCIPAPSFFHFCEEMLDKYREDTRIMHISGTNLQLGKSRTKYSYYFSKYPHIWGWATWKRAWDKYDYKMSSWPKLRDEGKMKDIFRDPKKQRIMTMIFDHLAKDIDTWDIQWIYTCVANHGLSIVPDSNLVSNIGYVENPTHNIFQVGIAARAVNSIGSLEVIEHPPSVEANTQADQIHFDLLYSGDYSVSGMEAGKVFYRFDFFEDNAEKMKTNLGKFMHIMSDLGINMKFLKLFPPCILDKEQDICLDGKQIRLDGKNLVVTNNFYFGKEYSEINKLVKSSPFISKKCRKCKYNKNFECRGLFNKKFLDVKDKITRKIGKDIYDSVRSDYENGRFVSGSACSNNCRFCIDNSYPKNILRRAPFFKPTEITHFLHYLPRKLEYVGASFHCKSGEITDSPYFPEISGILEHFMGGGWLQTKGNNINEGTLDLFKKIKAKVTVSIISFNPELRKLYIEGDENIDYLEKIRLLRKNNINYNVSIIPLKSLVESGDIFDTIKTLIEDDPSCLIVINPPTASRFMNSDIINELEGGYKDFKEKLPAKYKENIFFPDETDDKQKGILAAKVKRLKKKLKKICSDNKKYFILAPEKTFAELSSLNSSLIKVKKIKSSLGFSDSSSVILMIEDYKRAINDEAGNFDYAVAPRNSFDINLDDISLVNINKLWGYISKEACGLVLL